MICISTDRSSSFFLMSRVWIYLVSAICALLSPGIYQVEGMEVFTSSELEAVNGTNVLLKCTFKSTYPLSEDKITVSWSFRPVGQTAEESFFHYQRRSFLPTRGLFKDHAVWSGNVVKGDASITLQNVQFTFNGTFSCEVRNPPDVQGIAGEISLKVVSKGIYQAEGMEVFTSSELEAVNGTNVLLKCTFKSTYPLSENKTTVSWSFRPVGQTAEESFFHYQQISFLPTRGLFKDHAVWSGNVVKGDGSITLQNVQFTFNGTFSCQVRNPPDIQGIAGEISLKVVSKVSNSEIAILAIAVGGSIGIILLILIIYVFVRLYRKNDMSFEMDEHKSKNQVL